MLCGWGGNRRSGVALAVRHRLQWFIHLRAHGPRKGVEHPAYTPHGVWHTLPLQNKLTHAELSKGCVDPWVVLGRDFSVFVGMSWVHYGRSGKNLKGLCKRI